MRKAISFWWKPAMRFRRTAVVEASPRWMRAPLTGIGAVVRESEHFSADGRYARVVDWLVVRVAVNPASLHRRMMQWVEGANGKRTSNESH